MSWTEVKSLGHRGDRGECASRPRHLPGKRAIQVQGAADRHAARPPGHGNQEACSSGAPEHRRAASLSLWRERNREDGGPVIKKGKEVIHHGCLPLLTLRITIIREFSVPKKQLAGGVCGSRCARKALSLLVSQPTPGAAR